MEEIFKCPRCGSVQEPSETCSKCGVHIQRYIELQRSRHIVPGTEASQRREREPRTVGLGTHRKNAAPPPPPPPHGPEEPSHSTEMPPPYDEEETQVQSGVPRESLTDIGNLFQSAWEIFKRRFWPLILLYILSVVLLLVVFGIFFGTGFLLSRLFSDVQHIIMAGGAFVGVTAGFVAMFWGLAAFICAVADDDLGIREAFSEGSQKIWSFLWVFTLLSYIITGGFFLFFIPGILFSVWFLFAQFILAKEGVRGMDSLLKSKNYVKGFWFDVFLRLFLVWIISVVLGMIPLIGGLVSLVYIPFMMIFIFLIYNDLRAVRGPITSEYAAAEKFKWIGLATLGYIVLPIFMLMLLGATLTRSLFSIQDVLKIQGIPFP